MRKPHPLPYSGGGWGFVLLLSYLLFNASKK